MNALQYDAAVMLDDWIQEAGLPDEGWAAKVATGLWNQDVLQSKILARTDELFKSAPTFNLKVTMTTGETGTMQVQAFTGKQAMMMAMYCMDCKHFNYETVSLA